MNALPLLLLGGAAVLMMSGGKKGPRLPGEVVDSGKFGSGEDWRIRRQQFGYAVDVKPSGHRWTNTYGASYVWATLEEARAVVDKIDRGALTMDASGRLEA
jgi:hypothetical protein